VSYANAPAVRASAVSVSAGSSAGAVSATIAAVLLPGERARVDAAGSGCFAVVHRDSIPDAVRTVRERPVDAVLVSVHRVEPAQVESVAQLVRAFPGVPTVALVSRHDAESTEAILRLGATGVRQVVDVSSPAGWHRLREVVGRPATRAIARIQGPLFVALADDGAGGAGGAGAAALPPDARLFLEALVRLAPETPTVRQLCRHLAVRPSTLMSRFARAGLPSPKRYLAAMRLLHAAFLFDGGGLAIADVAYRLEYSSPQSFGRHVRAMLGITGTEYRRAWPFARALERFLAELIEPYARTWRAFSPLRPARL